MTTKEKRHIVACVSDILAENGDMFFSSGNLDTDCSTILETLRTQGRWAGTRYYYYFDEHYDLTEVTERRFGA